MPSVKESVTFKPNTEWTYFAVKMCFRRRLRTQPRYGAEYHKYEIKQLLDNRNFIQETMKIVLQKLPQAVKKAFRQLHAMKISEM